jgi:hypothetical protein
MRALDAGTVRQERRGRGDIVATLTNSLQTRNGPLTEQVYCRSRGAEEPDLRLIVTLTAALTVLLLVLSTHP